MAERAVQVASQQSGKAKAKPTNSNVSTVKADDKETRSSKEDVRRLSTTSSSANSDVSRGTPSSYQKELLAIVSEIRSNQKTQETRLSAIETKFNTYEGEEYDYDEYGYDDSYVEPESESGNPRDANNNVESAFKELGTKYNVQEKLDMEVDDFLASITNSVFREGLPDEKFKSLVAQTGRPSNCDGLTKTRVNNVIWNLLSPEMHSADGKMQSIQDGILKAATIVVKLLNMTSDRLCKAELEFGTDALGLLGQANKLINNTRKSMHKKELNVEYHHLCSQSRGYTDSLYGDDVGKDVKEIQDINRIGSKIRFNQFNQPYQRGHGGRSFHRVFRGRVAKPRGRGRGGFQRPKNTRGVFNK